jgi:hypothetical protein
MSLMGHSRLGEASWRSNHVRNAPLATVGPKKAACRDGPDSDIKTRSVNRTPSAQCYYGPKLAIPARAHASS